MSTRIFIADDHAIVRDGLKAIFANRCNMVVVGEAGDGRTALFGILQLQPDVVLLDIVMPGLNGVECLRRLRQEGASAKVLILSMHSTSEHIYQALDAGANGYLLKESAGSELIAAIQSVCANRRYISGKISPAVMAGYQERRHGKTTESPLTRLSLREREVLQLVVEGRSSAEIATLLSLSPKTVETYRSRLMSKLGVGSLVELVKFALQHQLFQL